MAWLFPPRSPLPLGSLAIIAGVVAAGAGAFAYTAGWLSPGRLTPNEVVAAFKAPGDSALGHRRNHAVGICFTGVFESNGSGVELSRAKVFAPGRSVALGRFNLGTPDPNATDASVRVRGMGLQLTAPGGDVWRMAMIDPPFFPVATPEAFYQMLEATGSKNPDAVKDFTEKHPEFAVFNTWAKEAPWTASFAEDPFNSLDAFIAVNAAGVERAVRWSFLPQASVTPITQDELAKLGADYLQREIAERVAKSPQHWTLTLTIANPGDPTSDPSKPWPAGRRTIEAGVLTVQKIEPERDGPCRDINFDPTILPDGISVSDDPFPAARSAAYAKSYDLRTSEVRYYPYHQKTEAGIQ